jgi:hypothetical protein
MVDQRLKNLSGTSRRRFLRWTAAAGALFALDRSRVLDVVNDSAGTALADEGACNTTNRSVHFVGGNGGFAWFTLLFPHVEQATTTAGNVAFHATGAAKAATDTDKPFYFAPETLGRSSTRPSGSAPSWPVRTRRTPPPRTRRPRWERGRA